MDPPVAELIALAVGAAMGFVNNLAGAGGVLGLLVLDLVYGLAPGDANVALRPSALAIGLSGMAGFRSLRQRVPARAWGYALAAIPGALAGAMFAVRLPVIVYQVVLVGIIAALLLLQLGAGARAGSTPRPVGRPLSIGLFVLVGLHMGFVQVGTGLLAIAVLSRVHSKDLVVVNAAKMSVVFATSLSATLYFAAEGAIEWQPALWLAAGAGAGSFAAGRWSVRRGHGAIRTAVLVIAILALARAVWQIAFG